MIVSSTAFLCGYFSADPAGTSPERWTPIPALSGEATSFKNFYFPEFVDFFARDVTAWRLDAGADVSIPARDGTVTPFRIDGIRLFRMPREQVLFAVKLVFSKVDLNKLTYALNVLRNSCFYDLAVVGEPFFSAAIAPLDEAYEALTCKKAPGGANHSHLVENGNKFKIFHILQTDRLPADMDRRDQLLYAVGTLSPYSPDEPPSTDPRYFSRIMDASRIGVFSSWTALALLDTLTFVSEPLPAYREAAWQNEYFGMIYLYELYRKCVLYHFNVLFREGKRDPSVLQKELDEFGRKYTFTAVSYNFLPVEIDRAVQKGLDMGTEDVQLSRFIDREVAARVEESDNRRERFLLFLTLLASFSAIWDIVCLLDELIDYDALYPTGHVGYRIFTAILFSVVAFVAWRTKRGSRNGR